MERYFDAFLYLANWGTRQLMFRLPREVLDAETAKEKDALLARVVSGEGAAVQALLSRRFRRACGGTEPVAATRTAAELWKTAGDRKAAREKAEEEHRREQQAHEAAVKAAAYARRLDELATGQEAAWERVSTLIETKSPRDYDIAVTLLSDLRALAERRGETAAFTSRFCALREQHQRKPSRRGRPGGARRSSDVPGRPVARLLYGLSGLDGRAGRSAAGSDRRR
jgi:hypothetical protein